MRKIIAIRNAEVESELKVKGKILANEVTIPENENGNLKKIFNEAIQRYFSIWDFSKIRLESILFRKIYEKTGINIEDIDKFSLRSTAVMAGTYSALFKTILGGPGYYDLLIKQGKNSTDAGFTVASQFIQELNPFPTSISKFDPNNWFPYVCLASFGLALYHESNVKSEKEKVLFDLVNDIGALFPGNTINPRSCIVNIASDPEIIAQLKTLAGLLGTKNSKISCKKTQEETAVISVAMTESIIKKFSESFDKETQQTSWFKELVNFLWANLPFIICIGTQAVASWASYEATYQDQSPSDRLTNTGQKYVSALHTNLHPLSWLIAFSVGLSIKLFLSSLTSNSQSTFSDIKESSKFPLELVRRLVWLVSLPVIPLKIVIDYGVKAVKWLTSDPNNSIRSGSINRDEYDDMDI